MYIKDSEDVRYWQSEADDAHRWQHVIHQMWMSVHRRRQECGQFPPFSVSDELMQADLVFYTRYHYALAQRTAARSGLTLETVLAA